MSERRAMNKRDYPMTSADLRHSGPTEYEVVEVAEGRRRWFELRIKGDVWITFSPRYRSAWWAKRERDRLNRKAREEHGRMERVIP